MTYMLALAALALLPVLAITFLRVNGATAFMSLCMGSVLATYVARDITTIVTSFAAKGALSTNQWVQLVLLVVPFALTIIFARKKVKGAKRFLNILPALACGILFALLVVPLLSASVQHHIHATVLWRELDNLETAAVLGGAAFSLLFLFMARPKPDEEGKKHKG